MSTKLLRELITAERELEAAKLKLELAKSAATKYIIESGVESADVDGYTLSLKQYKRQRTNKSEKLVELSKLINSHKQKLADQNSAELYKLQKENFYNELKIAQLLSSDEVQELQQEYKSEVAKIAAADSSYFEVFAKVNTKNSEYLNSVVEQRQLTEMIAEGAALKKTTGKSISKQAVIKFVLAWSVEKLEPLDKAWEKKVKLHKQQHEII